MVLLPSENLIGLEDPKSLRNPPNNPHDSETLLIIMKMSVDCSSMLPAWRIRSRLSEQAEDRFLIMDQAD